MFHTSLYMVLIVFDGFMFIGFIGYIKNKVFIYENHLYFKGLSGGGRDYNIYYFEQWFSQSNCCETQKLMKSKVSKTSICLVYPHIHTKVFIKL